MHWKSPQYLIIKAKYALRQRIHSFWGILRALLKTGIPERFWVGFFLIGFALGFGLKEMALTSFTIGYGDYRLPEKQQLFDLNASRDTALANGSELTEPKQKTEYPNCLLESE